MSDLTLLDIRKTFAGGIVAVDEVSLDLRSGELTALLGPSGCGKTTLLRIIAGLESADGGRILASGSDITALPAHRRRFGMVFQSFALFPHLDVADNVAYSLAISGVSRRVRRARAKELLDLVQLSGFGGRRIGELSGGQRQRVAIARALAQEPEIFLLDEPMSALDAKLREEMQIELRLLQQKLGITTIVVTHDQREAMTMADRIVVMSAGRAVQVGPPQNVYRHPSNAFVAGFIGKANFLAGTVRGGAVETAGGLLRTDPVASFRDGSPVTLVCRPEAVRLADAPGVNRLAVAVTFVRDVGPTREIHLACDGARLIAELSFADVAPFTAGTALYAELPPGALHVFPRSEAAEAA